jgi:competence protein ComFC
MIRTLSGSILSLIFPQECRVCGGEVEFLDDGVACETCWASTKIFTGNETLCEKCGAFLFASSSSRSIACRKCADHDYDQALSLGSYEKALSAAIVELKRVPHLNRRIKQTLRDVLMQGHFGNSDILIPVPLSSRRSQERGFNQAAVIAREVSRHLGVPADESTLVRKVHTPMHRAGMDKKARAMTVKNAFEVVRPKLIEGKVVLLVDDIFTSGETASNCARVLKKSGARIVNVLTIAHAA